MSSSRALDELKEKKKTSTHTQPYRDKIQMHTNNTQHTRIPLTHMHTNNLFSFRTPGATMSQSCFNRKHFFRSLSGVFIVTVTRPVWQLILTASLSPLPPALSLFYLS